MKTSIKIIPFLLVAFYSISIKAQDILWEKSFGGVHADYLMDALPTPDFGFILAGSSLSAKTGNKTQDNNGDLDYWVWKMKENGDLDWQKSFGGSGNDFLHSIKLTNDGGFVLAGTSASTLPELGDSSQAQSNKKEACRGGDDIWVIKLDASGTQEWQKTIGGMAQEKLKAICPTKDGGYILGGSSASPSPSKGGEFDPEELKLYGEKKSEAFGNMDYWLVKLDRKGKIEWQKSFGGIYEEELRSIVATNDGGYIVGGYSNSPISGNKTEDNKGVGDFWVLKLDSKGEITWQKTIGGNQDDQLYIVHQTYDGNYIVGGNSNSDTSNEKSRSNASGTDIWILKLGQEGEVLWQETYNIGEVDVLSSIVENKDRTLLLGGFCQAEGSKQKAESRLENVVGRKQKQEKGIGDYVAIKITETGEEIWRQSVGTDGDDLLKKVVETRDGGYLLAGISLPPESPSPTLPKGKGVATGNGKEFANIQQTQNKGLQNGINEVNNGISEVQNNINKEITDKMTSTTNTINDKLGSDKKSSLKYGLNTPTGGVTLPNLGSGGNGENALDGLANPMSSKQGKPSTGDQKKAFGSSDFWVVKLRDKDKKGVVRTSIEAMPNPATTFTNVIVGYEYQTGTATVADIAGHVLQQFEIKSQTIPIDLSAYPEGIYVVNIKTNKGNDGVKVIKTLNRN
jgi:Secretion system C-terminal sorting domain